MVSSVCVNCVAVVPWAQPNPRLPLTAVQPCGAQTLGICGPSASPGIWPSGVPRASRAGPAWLQLLSPRATSFVTSPASRLWRPGTLSSCAPGWADGAEDPQVTGQHQCLRASKPPSCPALPLGLPVLGEGPCVYACAPRFCVCVGRMLRPSRRSLCGGAWHIPGLCCSHLRGQLRRASGSPET